MADERLYSPDGHYWWDPETQQWQPVQQLAGTVPGPGTGPQPEAGPTESVGSWKDAAMGCGLLVVIVVVLAVGCSVLTGGDGADSSGTAASDLSENDDLPADQRDWLAAVGAAQEAAEDGNEMQVVRARKERAAAMCEVLGKDLEVVDWVGEVETVDTTLGGDSGVVRVEVAQDVSVGTWNNGFSDALDDTLIEPDSGVWDQVIDLEEGDPVVFSGTFAGEDANCISESSVMDLSGVSRPEFILRFSQVAPAAE